MPASFLKPWLRKALPDLSLRQASQMIDYPRQPEIHIQVYDRRSEFHALARYHNSWVLTFWSAKGNDICFKHKKHDQPNNRR